MSNLDREAAIRFYMALQAILELPTTATVEVAQKIARKATNDSKDGKPHD